MGPWRLEVLRTWRTRRAVALGATFLILGLGSPALTYFLPQLVKGAGNGVRITLPKQTPHDALVTFAGNLAQLGTLVVVLVAAASLAIDAHPGLAAFYRTRVHRATHLVLPRYLVVTAASLLALALGTAGALYETTALLGHVPLLPLVAGFGLEALWLCFVVSIVAAVASMARSVLSVVGISIAVLLVLAVLGNVSAVRSWLPNRLASSASLLVASPANGIWHAAITAFMAMLAGLALAVYRFGTREA